jgi:hypothetical protein
LFFVTTFAMAAEYQPLPFPQDANTALAGAGQQSGSIAADMPASMASNQSTSFAVHSGSPFPAEANPSATASTSEQGTPAAEREHDLGSPFPADAAPSRN